MSELLEEIEYLEQQETGLRQQYEQAMILEAKENIGAEINVVVGQLVEKREALNKKQREAEVEEKVNAEPVPFSILGIDLNGMPVEFAELVEGVYRTTLRNCLNEHAIELEQAENQRDELAHDYEKANQAYSDAMDQVAELKSDNAELIKFNSVLQGERDEARQYRDNSAAIIAEKDAEISRLAQLITEYEQAEEFRQRQEQPLAVSSEESTSLQEKADAVKKLFIGRENWGSVEKLFLPDGSFTVVPRAELVDWEALDVPETDEVAEEPTIEAPTFRETDTTVQEHTIDGEVDADATTDDGDGETFEQEVRRRLDMLEYHCFLAPTQTEAA